MQPKFLEIPEVTNAAHPFSLMRSVNMWALSDLPPIYNIPFVTNAAHAFQFSRLVGMRTIHLRFLVGSLLSIAVSAFPLPIMGSVKMGARDDLPLSQILVVTRMTHTFCMVRLVNMRAIRDL